MLQPYVVTSARITATNARLAESSADTMKIKEVLIGMNLANLIVQSLWLETFTCMVATVWKSKTENHTIDTIVASTDA